MQINPDGFQGDGFRLNPGRQFGHSRDQGNSAFTLIELLVVIGIISLLAGLLLATVANAKAGAQSAKCKGNLRQLGLAVKMYVDDYGAYPFWFNPDSQKYWYELLPAYTRTRGNAFNYADPIFTCPTFKRAPGTYWTASSSYGYNANGTGVVPLGATSGGAVYGLGLGGFWVDGSTEFRPRPTPEAGVKTPSNLVALGDAFVGLPKGQILRDTSWNVGLMQYESPGLPPGGEQAARARHRGNLNIVLCDNHVEAVKYKTLLSDHSDERLRRWNNDHEPHWMGVR